MGAAPSETESVVQAAGRKLPASVLRYLEARGVLVTIEAQEAFQQVLRALALGTVAVVLGFTGWLLVMAGAVAALAAKTDWSWMLASAVVGGANVLLGVILFMLLMSRLSRTRWFEHTINEFGKDRKWLAHHNEKS